MTPKKRSAARRMNFTQRALDALQCPPGEDRLYAYDTGQRGLGIRVLPTGKRMFVYLGKSHGRTVRVNLGEYPSELTIAAARKYAEEERHADRRGLRVQSIAIDDAFGKALDATKRGAKAKGDWEYAKKRFVAFLESRYPAVKKWEQVTRAMVREYLRTKDGLSDTTRRLALQPIVQTARFIAREHGVHNVADGLGLGSKLAKPPASVYVRDALSFLDYLRRTEEQAFAKENGKAATLEVGAALQSLAGLQLQEATRLTWDRVDLKRGLVEISGEVKNEYRNRIVPVCARVLDALGRAYGRRPALVGGVQDIKERVVLSEKGLPYAGGSWFNYSKAITCAIRAWNPKAQWQPKDLRNCLPTLAMMKGVGGFLWEQYIGHSPRTVTGRHYVPRLASATKGEEEALEKQMDVFRRFVVDVIEAEIAAIREKEAQEGASVIEIAK